MNPEYSIGSILVVKLDHIGDMILATPVFEAIKKRYPGCFLGVLCSSVGKLALKNNPYIDRCWVFDADMFDRQGKNNAESKRRDLESVLEIRSLGFDVCVGLREDHQNVPILSMLGAKKTVSFYRDTRYPFLLDDGAEHIGGKHTALVNFDVLKLIDVPQPEEVVPHLYPSAEDEQWADDVLTKEGVDRNSVLVGISPGGGWFLNWWPWERYAALCDRLSNYDPRIRVVVFGGKAEKPLYEKISGAAHAALIDATNPASVQQTGALMRRMRCIVSNDGGPMHMATAVGTPVVALFGPSPTWFFPLGGKNHIIRKDFSCSPCPQFVAGEEPKCLDNKCMKAISVEEVFRAAAAMIEGTDR